MLYSSIKNEKIKSTSIITKEATEADNFILPKIESPVKTRSKTLNEKVEGNLNENKLFYLRKTSVETNTSDLFYLGRRATIDNKNDTLNTSNISENDFQEEEVTPNPITESKANSNNEFFNNNSFNNNDFDYFSIKSKKIQSLKLGHGIIENKVDKNLSDLLIKHKYLVFYVEFNYFNLIKWGKEYLTALYPEINLIAVIELDDDVKTQQKIILMRSEKSEDKHKYLPLCKQNDQAKKTGYRFIRYINYTNNNFKNSHKLKISMCTYSNDQLGIFSEEEIYFETRTDQEMHKFQFLSNMMSNFALKKIGNIFLSFTYKMENLKMSIVDDEEMTTQYITLFSVK